MIDEDMDAVKTHFPDWALKLGKVNTIALLSPNREQTDFIKQLFPKAKIVELSVNNWDLDDPGTGKYDLIYAASVMMAAPNAKAWMDNVLSCCKRFWIQDHIRRWRGGATECDPPTGDLTRFTYKEHKARVENPFDLETVDVQAFEAYRAGDGAGPGKDAVSFIADIVGSLYEYEDKLDEDEVKEAIKAGVVKKK